LSRHEFTCGIENCQALEAGPGLAFGQATDLF
jgi:hypothetical protein